MPDKEERRGIPTSSYPNPDPSNCELVVALRCRHLQTGHSLPVCIIILYIKLFEKYYHGRLPRRIVLMVRIFGFTMGLLVIICVKYCNAFQTFNWRKDITKCKFQSIFHYVMSTIPFEQKPLIKVVQMITSRFLPCWVMLEITFSASVMHPQRTQALITAAYVWEFAIPKSIINELTNK